MAPRKRNKLLRAVSVCLLLSGCATIAKLSFDDQFGPPAVVDRQVEADSSWGKRYRQQVKPILDQRCAVCHGCYDAPCQLQFTSPEGIDRGASQAIVYDGTRLTEVAPTRLFIDAPDTHAWRQKGFYPILNERRQTEFANTEASVFYRLLDLKLQHPLPVGNLLPETFTLGTNRQQECTNIENFAQFAQQNPLWGMPYALPGLNPREFAVLRNWLAAGAPYPKEPPLPVSFQLEVEDWEQFFNRDSLKGRLVARYLYEHLFLGHLYFEPLGSEYFFTLVRSSTPPGQPIELIATRRPYDNPGVERVYYRLQPVRSTLLAKTHMPYALNTQRMRNWESWFFDDGYEVNLLPGYDAETASNPFKAFAQIPVQTRYRFLIDEAHFTISGFIKGPVCRGQVALNVIQDRFWVFFLEPDHLENEIADKFLAEQSDHLRLPSEAESTLRPGLWLKYSGLQRAYLEAKYKALSGVLENQVPLNLNVVWDGDGKNDNAALTVFRHFDSATVVKGLVGEQPQTAWLIGYSVLERIHYLLVAGFDVYGNIGHQLLSRLYMDFLRMESEFNFLSLLPAETREREWGQWYEGVTGDVRDYVRDSSQLLYRQSDIVYRSDDPKQELFQRLQARFKPALSRKFLLSAPEAPPQHLVWLQQLARITGVQASLLPQVVIISVEDDSGQLHFYTLLHDNAHSNISSLLREESNRRPERDRVTVVRGILGAYPSAFWHLHEQSLPNLANAVSLLSSESDYQSLMNNFGIRRTNPLFWSFSDRLHDFYQQTQPVDFGLLDFNRLENR